MDNTPGIDVSRWQGEIDWQQVAAAGYRFAMIRATVGDYYTDPRFYINWSNAKEAGLLVSAYHVVVPKNTVYSQMDRLFDVLGDRVPDLPLVMDVERHDKVSKAQITAAIQGCLNKAEQHDGRRPVIYTAKWFWDNPNYVNDSPEWSSYDLWVANYVDDPANTGPLLPDACTTWTFWQYTEKGSVPGVPTNCDLNWFGGTLEDLVEYGRKDHTSTDPEPGAGPIRARIITDDLNVRSGPGTQYEKVGQLQKGDIITITELTGSEVWVQFAPGQWVAMIYDDARYVDFLRE